METYEDCRSLTNAANFICSQDIISSNGKRLIREGTKLDKKAISYLEQKGVTKLYILKDVDDVYKTDQNVSDDLVNSVDKAYTNIIQGEELTDEFKDKLFNMLYFCNENHFVSMMSYIRHIERSDGFTYEHSLKVSWLVIKLGKCLGLPDKDLKDLMQVALLHDIGKSCIPYNVLNKKGRLSKDEFELVKRHPLLGFNMIHNIVKDEIAYGILHHHEKINGTGYPHGIKGKEIPLYSKIVSVIDVFEALIAYRPYKARMSPIEAMKILKEMTFKGELEYYMVDVFIRGVMDSLIGGIQEIDENKKKVIMYDKNSIEPVYVR